MSEESTCKACERKLGPEEADEKLCVVCETRELQDRLWEEHKVLSAELSLLVRELNKQNGWVR